MANFRQNVSEPGIRAAGFLGRKALKTTIFTMGGILWNLLRDPDSTHALFSCIRERSIEIMHTVQRVFDSNDLFAWLYPEYVPTKNSKRWNDEEMVLPNRSRYSTNASLAPYGVCCSTAGIHQDNLHVDDPVGDTQLNSMRESGADMIRIGNWLKSNLRSLGKNMKTSIFYTGTRYAVDDAHAFIFDNIKEKHGDWEGMDDEANEHNEWIVYFNSLINQDGTSKLPETYSDDELVRIKKEDPWTYWTQIANRPKQSGLSELNSYDLSVFEISWDAVGGFLFHYRDVLGERVRSLKDCDLVFAVDPAASERGVSATTSRSALVAVAHAPDDVRFIFNVKCDYVPVSTLFEWIFTVAEKYKNFFRSTILELQGPFKLLKPVLRDEINKRKLEAYSKNRSFSDPNIQDTSKTGNKDAMIRGTLQPLLEQNLIYVEKSDKFKVSQELSFFPQSKKKDILDAITLGCISTIRPLDETEVQIRKKRDNRFRMRTANAAGY